MCGVCSHHPMLSVWLRANGSVDAKTCDFNLLLMLYVFVSFAPSSTLIHSFVPRACATQILSKKNALHITARVRSPSASRQTVLMRFTLNFIHFVCSWIFLFIFFFSFATQIQLMCVCWCIECMRVCGANVYCICQSFSHMGECIRWHRHRVYLLLNYLSAKLPWIHFRCAHVCDCFFLFLLLSLLLHVSCLCIVFSLSCLFVVLSFRIFHMQLIRLTHTNTHSERTARQLVNMQ